MPLLLYFVLSRAFAMKWYLQLSYIPEVKDAGR